MCWLEFYKFPFCTFVEREMCTANRSQNFLLFPSNFLLANKFPSSWTPGFSGTGIIALQMTEHCLHTLLGRYIIVEDSRFGIYAWARLGPRAQASIQFSDFSGQAYFDLN